MAAFARKHKISIPIISGPNRTLEKQLGVNEISLRNIFAVAILDAKGKVSRGNPTNLQSSVTRAIQSGAKWNLDPTQIPETMISTWQAVKFGDFPASASAIKKGIKSGKAELKAAAEKLNSFVQSKLDEQLAEEILTGL